MSSHSSVIQIAAPNHGQLSDIINTWHYTSKQQQRNHIFAAEYFQRQHNAVRIPLIVLAVLLGSSAVVETVHHTDPTSGEVQLGFVVLSVVLVLMSILQMILHALMDTVWKYARRANKHKQHARIYGQFCLQCERVVAQMALQRYDSDDNVTLDFFMGLMSTRANILDRQELLVFPPDKRIVPRQSATPLFVPSAREIKTRSPSSSARTRRARAHARARRHGSLSPTHARRRETPRLVTLVEHVRQLTRAESQDYVDETLRATAEQALASRDSSASSSSTAGGMSASCQIYHKVLKAWKAEAVAQSAHLTKRAHRLHRLQTYWLLGKTVPDVFLAFASTVSMTEEIKIMYAAAERSPALGIIASIMILCMLFVRSMTDALDGVLAFKSHADLSESHAKQLQNFSEHITTCRLHDHRATDNTRASNLEELRQMRQDIRDQFPLV